MRDRLRDAAALIREHRVGFESVDLAVEEHDRARDRREDGGDLGVAVVDERQHECVGPPLAERLETDALPGGVPAGTGDHEADVVAAEFLLDALGDPPEHVVDDRWHQQADEGRAGRPQAASADVDPVVDLPDRIEHARPRLGRDVRRAVQDARSCRLRDVCRACDVMDRGFSGRTRRTCLSRAHIYHSWRPKAEGTGTFPRSSAQLTEMRGWVQRSENQRAGSVAAASHACGQPSTRGSFRMTLCVIQALWA